MSDSFPRARSEQRTRQLRDEPSVRYGGHLEPATGHRVSPTARPRTKKVTRSHGGVSPTLIASCDRGAAHDRSRMVRSDSQLLRP